MDHDGFDYAELSRNVDDLLEDELGTGSEEFHLHLDESELPSMDFPVRNAANDYGGARIPAEQEPLPGFDEEAAAMHYDPHTNSGAAIRAYNADYATRAAQRANRGKRSPERSAQKRPAERSAPQRAPERGTQRPAERGVPQRTPERGVPQPPRRTQAAPYPDDRLPQTEEALYDEPRRRNTEPVKRKKKKHIVLKLLLALLALLLIGVLALWVFARQPDGDSLGTHRDGCAAILLAGTDADGMRTDTMMLLYLDQEAGEMNLLSLPRDTYTSMDISVPKLNAVYGIGGGGKEGMEKLMDYAEHCIGYRPDGYVLVDFNCFERLVNLMGGVQFHVPEDMTYDDPAQDLHIDLKEGDQKLNGEEAMWLVRYRSGYAMADLQRVQVQRDFIRAALEQWMSIKNIWRAPAAATLVTANTTTNLSLRELAWLAKAARSIGTSQMQTETLPGEATYVGDGSYYVLWPETTAELINKHFNPYEEPVSSESIYSPYY